jgi:hypothetical protein
MKATRFLMVIGVVCLSMFAANTTPAKNATLGSVEKIRSGGVVLVNRQQLFQLAKSLGLKVYAFKVSKHDARKLGSSGPNGCGCSLIQDTESSGGCFSKCLQSWGLGYGSTLACGGACIAAGTGNPIGIAVCAACLGTAEWIVMGCAMSCAWGRNIAMQAKSINPQHQKYRSLKTSPRLTARI